MTTCEICGRSTQHRVTVTGETVILNSHSDGAGFGLYTIRYDLRVMRVQGFAPRGYRVHQCPSDPLRDERARS